MHRFLDREISGLWKCASIQAVLASYTELQEVDDSLGPLSVLPRGAGLSRFRDAWPSFCEPFCRSRWDALTGRPGSALHGRGSASAAEVACRGPARSTCKAISIAGAPEQYRNAHMHASSVCVEVLRLPWHARPPEVPCI